MARHEEHSTPGETQSVESLTVLWSLCVFSTLILVLLLLLLRLVNAIWQPGEGASKSLVGFSDLMLFAAIVSGSIGGVLTPIVQSSRNRPAPRSLQYAAFAIAFSPWLIFVLLLVRS
ncbi:hypothetical protein GC197_09565 [bacterium]|nr:hypothetical protein [bacterium]